MTVLEIVLLVAGAILFVLSFIIPAKKQEASDDVRAMIEEEVKKKVTEETESIKKHVDGVVDEAVAYAQEKTERSLERISNEKIMAVNEYSDTVLEEINKNHKEVMFLYDMLNDKHDILVGAVNEASRIISETQESTIKATEAANAVKMSTREAIETASAFKALAPDTAAIPDFDISQVLKYSQNPVVSVPHTAPIENVNEQGIVRIAEGVYGAEVAESADSVKEEATVTLNGAQDEDASAGGKVRTLKWAEYAKQQADEALAEAEQGASENAEPTVAMNEEEKTVVQEAVIKLHEAGKSDVEIARSLDMGVGEVSLIIGLHGSDK